MIIDFTQNLRVYTSNPYGFMEFWNPTCKQIESLLTFLEENRTICFVWLYGEVEDIDDFSSLDSCRIVRPFYLGKTRQESERVLYENRMAFIGDFT